MKKFNKLLENKSFNLKIGMISLLSVVLLTIFSVPFLSSHYINSNDLSQDSQDCQFSNPSEDAQSVSDMNNSSSNFQPVVENYSNSSLQERVLELQETIIDPDYYVDNNGNIKRYSIQPKSEQSNEASNNFSLNNKLTNGSIDIKKPKPISMILPPEKFPDLLKGDALGITSPQEFMWVVDHTNETHEINNMYIMSDISLSAYQAPNFRSITSIRISGITLDSKLHPDDYTIFDCHIDSTSSEVASAVEVSLLGNCYGSVHIYNLNFSNFTLSTSYNNATVGGLIHTVHSVGTYVDIQHVNLEGTISGPFESIGGFIYNGGGLIKYCTSDFRIVNHADRLSKGSGFICYLKNSDYQNRTFIRHCVNYTDFGEFKCNGGACLGGFVGRTPMHGFEISSSKNYGNIGYIYSNGMQTNEGHAGGIVGSVSPDNDDNDVNNVNDIWNIIDCVNVGNVCAFWAGGIMGMFRGGGLNSYIHITNSVNRGTISAVRAGGILGGTSIDDMQGTYVPCTSDIYWECNEAPTFEFSSVRNFGTIQVLNWDKESDWAADACGIVGCFNNTFAKPPIAAGYSGYRHCYVNAKKVQVGEETIWDCFNCGEIVNYSAGFAIYASFGSEDVSMWAGYDDYKTIDLSQFCAIKQTLKDVFMSHTEYTGGTQIEKAPGPGVIPDPC